MKLSSKMLLAAISLPLTLAACASSSDRAATITASDLQHHNWNLVQIDGRDIVTKEGGKSPRLEIGENLTANGNAGCNNFFGQAELKDNQLRVDKMGMTMKMCMGDRMETEQAFSATLMDWSQVMLTDQTLTLKGKTHTLTFELAEWK
ncbi:META domain-containing protein [Vibrio sonorensis]|uniref:META domain-containing protein n=1 Tax=Vibrio sonorensis TaxID=1004316 RepID=UPI0008D9BFB7|nr:META domain-containing protein [Vibrio sonorensis]